MEIGKIKEVLKGMTTKSGIIYGKHTAEDEFYALSSALEILERISEERITNLIESYFWIDKKKHNTHKDLATAIKNYLEGK